MVSKTLFAVSDDETRYFMNGIFLEKRDDNLIMVATDGRRLSYISRRIPVRMENLKGVILPPENPHDRERSSPRGKAPFPLP